MTASRVCKVSAKPGSGLPPAPPSPPSSVSLEASLPLSPGNTRSLGEDGPTPSAFQVSAFLEDSGRRQARGATAGLPPSSAGGP